MTENPSSIAPRPRPGFKSRPEKADLNAKGHLIATTLRGLVGVVCLAVSLLYMPPGMVTPILSGISCLMIVTGAYGAWQVGRKEPLLQPFCRVSYWTVPLLGLLLFVLMLILGPGAFGPNWQEIVGTPEDDIVRYRDADGQPFGK
jgi:hypothetical protein